MIQRIRKRSLKMLRVYSKENLLNCVKICAQTVHGGTNDNLNAWPPWSCILFTQSPIPCCYKIEARSKPEKCNSMNKIKCKLFQMFWTRPAFICRVNPYSRDYTTLKSEMTIIIAGLDYNFNVVGGGRWLGPSMIIVYLCQKSGNWLERRDPGRWIDLKDGQFFVAMWWRWAF